MKLFKCQGCQQILYFENTVCVKSGHRLAYIPEMATLSRSIPPAIHGERSGRQAAPSGSAQMPSTRRVTG